MESDLSLSRRDLLAALGALGVLGAGDALTRLSSPYLQASGRTPLETLRYDVDPALIPGVSRRGRCVSNAQGLRGQLFLPGADNVLLVGGSTVYCQMLDEQDALHFRVRQGLGAGVRVATSARGGTKVKKSMQNLGALAQQKRTQPRVVIAMCGLNDMIHFYLHWKWPRKIHPLPIPPNSPFARANQRATHAGFRQAGTRGSWFPRIAKHYRDHAKLDTLSPGQSGRFDQLLARYQRDLRGLEDLCTRIGVKLLLATQPLSFGSDPKLTDRWCLYINPPRRQGFVPSQALMARMLERTNQRTRSFAASRGVPLVDLATLTGNEPMFYDQWHFSVLGAQTAGARLAEAAGVLLSLSSPRE